MIPDSLTLNAWAAVWSAQMVAVLWHSALLAGVVGLVASLLWRASPAARYWLWQIVAVKLLLMPLWSVSLALAWLPAPAEVNRTSHEDPPAVAVAPAPNEQIASSMPSSPQTLASDLFTFRQDNSTPGEARQPRLSWTAWLMLAWAVVVIGQLGLLLWHFARLRHLLKHASPAGAALESLIGDCAQRLKLARTPRVLRVDRECSPFVCGIWRPVMVLPKSLERLLADGVLAPVIVHELAHVKRLDLLWNWIPQIARMLYFFNPVVHWVAFRVRLEGELACDGWAMAATGQAADEYADLLVRIVGRLSEPAMLRSGSAASAGLDGHSSINKNE
jgi:beta-lactamase regulating signal transducer with metallopeptidase domain